MIFATLIKEPTVCLFITNKDIDAIRKGYTRTVRPEQTGGATFTGITIAFSKTDAEAADMLRQYTEGTGRPEPDYGPGEIYGPGESPCGGCKAPKLPALMFEGKCIVCWANEAKRLQVQSN